MTLGRGCGALGTLALLGCTITERVEVTLPPLEGARAALLVASADGRTRAWAFDPASPVALPALTDEGPIELAVAGLAYPLDRLGLEAGELELRTLTTGRSLRPLVAFEAHVDARAEAWARATALPAALAAVRLPAATGPCVAYDVSALAIPGDARAAVLIALDAERALVGTRDRTFFLATRASLQALPAMTGLPGSAGVRAQDGEIWLFGRGESAHGTLERGFTAGAPVPQGVDIVAVSAVPGSTRALDLMTVAASGELFRFDGARWTLLGPGGGNQGLGRAITALSADHVVYTAYSSSVHRYLDGRVRDELVYPDSAREIVSSTWVPGLGVVVGASIEGRVLVDRGDHAWRFLEAEDGGPAGLGIDVNEIRPYRGGFWAGGSTGAHTQWYPDWGFCAPGPALASKSVIRAVVLGDALVLTTDAGPGLSPTLAWLDPR